MVRAKFKCYFKGVAENAESPAAALKFHAVCDGSPENKEFFKYMPAGSIELQIVNKTAADKFEQGKEYYIDFTPVEN